MVKKPTWDKQEGAPLIISDPQGENPNPSFAEALMAGQIATGMIGGIEIVMQLTEILSGTSANAQIVQIIDGTEDRTSAADLHPGDTVFITRADMYSIEVGSHV